MGKQAHAAALVALGGQLVRMGLIRMSGRPGNSLDVIPLNSYNVPMATKARPSKKRPESGRSPGSSRTSPSHLRGIREDPIRDPEGYSESLGALVMQRILAERRAKFTVYLDRETHQALRIASVEDRVASTHVVERLIREYLAGRKKKGGRS